MRLNRRRLFTAAGVGAGAAAGLGGYAFGYEPRVRLAVTRYAPAVPNWPRALSLRVAVLTDIHTGGFAMPIERLEQIVEATNALQPDLILLLGDFITGRDSRHVVLSGLTANALSFLAAPLGTYAILGNHDWWDDPLAQRRKDGPTVVGVALDKVGIPVLENDAVRLVHLDQPFWLAGLGDMLAFIVRRTGAMSYAFNGRDDLEKTLGRVTDGAPVLLMAHEPDIFPRVPARVSLTLSGHTHGGQVRLFGWSPIVPSEFGNRYAYGHVVEQDRHLIVSAGLGTGTLPVRFGVPPEIVLLTLGQERALA